MGYFHSKTSVKRGWVLIQAAEAGRDHRLRLPADPGDRRAEEVHHPGLLGPIGSYFG